MIYIYARSIELGHDELQPDFVFIERDFMILNSIRLLMQLIFIFIYLPLDYLLILPSLAEYPICWHVHKM